MSGPHTEGAVSMSTEWMVEEPEPGWLGRLIAPRGGRKGRPATAAFLVGITGAVAFALSMPSGVANTVMGQPP